MSAWVGLACWLGLLLGAGAATASGANAATPTVIAQSAGPITSIATSSNSLVWRQPRRADYRNHCYSVVKRLNWRAGAVTTVVSCAGAPEIPEPLVPAQMAMGTSTVVYGDVDDEINCCTDDVSVVLHSSTAGALDASDHVLRCGGAQIVNLVAHGSLAAYTRSIWSPLDPSTDCWAGDYMGGGSETMTGGQVMTVALPAGKPRALSGAPPARFMDIASGLLALVPYDVAAGTENAFPPARSEIQLWNLTSRTRVRTVAESGVIRALAMRGDLLAVLVDGGAGNLRIDTFSASTGAHTGTTAVPASTAPTLAVYYRSVVYVAGKTVDGLNTENGSIHTIATPTYAPRKILAAHGSAVWYALAGGHGRIVAAPLP